MNKKLIELSKKLKQRVNEHRKPQQRVSPDFNPTPIGAEDIIELLDGLAEMYGVLELRQDTKPTQ